MNALEVGELLATMAVYDHRNTGEVEVTAWLKVVADLDYADAETAVIGHYQETSEWIMPAHVRQRVRAVRQERLLRTPLPEIPDEVADDPTAYLKWVRRETERIASGATDLRAIEGGQR